MQRYYHETANGGDGTLIIEIVFDDPLDVSLDCRTPLRIKLPRDTRKEESLSWKQSPLYLQIPDGAQFL